MTRRELAIIAALENIVFQPATSKKRFAKDMIALAERAPETELSAGQTFYLECLAYTFRRQMPRALVPPGPPRREVANV